MNGKCSHLVSGAFLRVFLFGWLVGGGGWVFWVVLLIFLIFFFPSGLIKSTDTPYNQVQDQFLPPKALRGSPNLSR